VLSDSVRKSLASKYDMSSAIYIYIYMCVCVYIYILYIHIYIYQCILSRLGYCVRISVYRCIDSSWVVLFVVRLHFRDEFGK
jgi:hypothetical protein